MLKGKKIVVYGDGRTVEEVGMLRMKEKIVGICGCDV